MTRAADQGVRVQRVLGDAWALPRLDAHNRAFFTAGVLTLQQCSSCAHVQHPPDDVCEACGGFDLGWFASAGDGRIESVAVVNGSGGRQSQLVVAKDSGVSVEVVETPVSKLATTLTVTNLGDEELVCNGPNAYMTLAAPAGSLRDVLDTANTNGVPDTIVFSVDTNSPSVYTDYSAASQVFHITINRALDLSEDGTTILGETAPDTNPFGPDVAIQPLNRQGILSALLDMAPDPPEPFFNAFNVSASGCTISNLIIAPTNFGGFLPTRIYNCTDGTMSTDVTVVDQKFIVPIDCTGSGNVFIGSPIGG